MAAGTAFVRCTAALATTTLALSVAKPHIALCQDAGSPQNKCATSEILKPAKTVDGTYSEEAKRKNAEGTVLLCATVDKYGRVTDVIP